MTVTKTNDVIYEVDDRTTGSIIAFREDDVNRQNNLLGQKIGDYVEYEGSEYLVASDILYIKKGFEKSFLDNSKVKKDGNSSIPGEFGYNFDNRNIHQYEYEGIQLNNIYEFAYVFNRMHKWIALDMLNNRYGKNEQNDIAIVPTEILNVILDNLPQWHDELSIINNGIVNGMEVEGVFLDKIHSLPTPVFRMLSTLKARIADTSKIGRNYLRRLVVYMDALCKDFPRNYIYDSLGEIDLFPDNNIRMEIIGVDSRLLGMNHDKFYSMYYIKKILTETGWYIAGCYPSLHHEKNFNLLK